MRAATERHNALLRAAIGAHGGNAFCVVGDAFCVAFAEARGAVEAAVDAQRALRGQAWGDACAIGRPADALLLAQSVVDTFARTGAPTVLASGLTLLVGAHRALGNAESARGAMSEAIEAQGGLDPSRGLPSVLEAVAATYPDAEAAPILLGSAAALRERWQVRVFAPERDEYERAVAKGRALERSVSSARSCWSTVTLSVISSSSSFGSSRVSLSAPRMHEASSGSLNCRREIDRDREGGESLCLPFNRLAAGAGQHPAAEGEDQPGLFRKGNECLRRYQAPVGMLPVDERFDARRIARGDRRLGLIDASGDLCATTCTCARSTSTRPAGRSGTDRRTRRSPRRRW